MHLSSLPPTLTFSFAIFILLHNSRQTPFLNLLLIGCENVMRQRPKKIVHTLICFLRFYPHFPTLHLLVYPFDPFNLSMQSLWSFDYMYSINLMNHLSVRYSSDFYTNYRTFNRIYILNFFENVHTISVRYGKFPQFHIVCFTTQITVHSIVFTY